MIRTEIAWPSDREIKFKNPLECKDAKNNTECLKEKFSAYAKPKEWRKSLWELDMINPENNGLQNEDLIVWMRTATFPNFRKTYRKINHSDASNIALSKHFEEGIPKGSYSFIIKYNFEVASFSGTKQLILSTRNIFGGKNNFLGIAYTVVGFLCIIISTTLFVSHKLYGQSLERDVDIVAAIAAENIPNNVPKIMLEGTVNNFLVIPEN